MSDPILDPSDLDLYLGIEIDCDRAAFILAKAQELCESVISPLPAGASAVVLDVAARAFSNPMSVQSQGVGPFPVSFTAGGLRLTTANERALRRLNGQGGAFSINLLTGYTEPALPAWDDSSGAPVIATS